MLDRYFASLDILLYNLAYVVCLSMKYLFEREIDVEASIYVRYLTKRIVSKQYSHCNTGSRRVQTHTQYENRHSVMNKNCI